MDNLPISIFALGILIHVAVYLLILKRHWNVSGGDIAHWVMYALFGLAEIVLLTGLSFFAVFKWAFFAEYMAGVFVATLMNVLIFIVVNYFRYREK